MNPTGYSSDSAVQYDTARSGGSKRDGEGMEVLPLHPKSLVALQELQNEVGALLEFRDLVIETFPNLRNKMSCVAGVAPPSSSIPLPATARRDWEAGTRVRRKLLRENDLLEGSLSRSRSNSHSKLGSGGVQDSGFSTDATSTSSKDSSTPSAAGGNAGSSSTGQIPAYDELWSLLDVIHRKGTRLRDEAKQLAAWNDSDDESKPFRQHLLSATPRDLVILRQERDNLLDRVTDMEASNLVGKVKTNSLKAKVESLVAAKNDLQKELDNALSEKTELNTRLERLLHESGRSSRNVLVNGSFRPLSPHHRTSFLSDKSLDRSVGEQQLVLGRLDGVLGSPYKSQRLRAPDPQKITAILQEKNHVELQRHLLTATAENQTLTVRLNECARSRRLLQERLEKTREENEDLRFQLEERNIELEGTRAHLRIVEGKTHKHTLSHDTIRPSVILNNDSLKHLSPVVINDVHTPVAMKNMSPYSSSTESAHDTAEPEASATSTSPRRRPSRIPLPGTSRPTSAISPTSVKQTRSPNRSLSRDSVRSVSSIPIARSPHSTLGTPRNTSSPAPRLKRDSLTGRVRNHDSLSRVRENNSSSTPSHKSVSNKSRSPHLGGDNNKTIKPAWTESSQLTIRPEQSATIQTSLIRQYLNKQRVPPCLDTNKPLDTLFNNFNLQEDTQPQGLWDLTYHTDDYPDQIDSENITLNTQNHSISSIDYFDSINSAILDSSCFVGTSSHNKSGGGEDLAYCDSLQMSFIDSGQ